MKIVSIIIGLFFLMCGFLIKTKKWLWIHQGLYKRPVDVDNYCNYMGLVDIIAGITYILLGILFFYFNISDIAVYILLITYFILTIYGESKYRIK